MIAAALATYFPDEFDEPLSEFDIPDHPRGLAEILVAEQEFSDRIRYQRSINGMHPLGEMDERGLRSSTAPRISALTTTSKWGMLNGKLSALRWVLGSEWDFLDTEHPIWGSYRESSAASRRSAARLIRVMCRRSHPHWTSIIAPDWLERGRPRMRRRG